MKLLIKNGHVVDPSQKMDEVINIGIEDGKIVAFGIDDEDNFDEVIDAKGMIVAPGLIDGHVHFRDPGLTYKEDIHTGAKAAAKGGFTTVICMANTRPVVDNEETLSYIIEEGKKTGIHVRASACVTKGLRGQELVDFSHLKECGAVGFTDDGIPLMNEILLKEAMEACATLKVPISLHEEHPNFIEQNGIHQGEVSKQLGFYGSPALAEDLMVARDCMLALHTKASVNIQHISSAGAVKMVKATKELGANVVAEVTPHHFSLTDQALLSHQSLAKMNPPLRSEADRMALIEGLKDGSIDMIATDHAPHSESEKEKPLALAPSGIIGLETALGLAITNLVRTGHLTLSQLIEKMSTNPAQFYQLDGGSLAIGRVADVVIFEESASWMVGESYSKSSNTPFKGQTLYGKVAYTICDGTIVYQHN